MFPTPEHHTDKGTWLCRKLPVVPPKRYHVIVGRASAGAYSRLPVTRVSSYADCHRHCRRGIDVDRVTTWSTTICPNIPESYVHRIGRTGARVPRAFVSFAITRSVLLRRHRAVDPYDDSGERPRATGAAGHPAPRHPATARTADPNTGATATAPAQSGHGHHDARPRSHHADTGKAGQRMRKCYVPATLGEPRGDAGDR